MPTDMKRNRGKADIFLDSFSSFVCSINSNDKILVSIGGKSPIKIIACE